MNRIIELLKTSIWFLKRPSYISHVSQILDRRKNQQKENTREEATLWCKEKAVSQKDALQALGVKSDFKLLEELFPHIMETAKQAEMACPMQMGGEGAISFLYHLSNARNVKYAMESGVAYGWSSLAILLAINEVGEGSLLSNDMPYIKMNNEDFVGCVVPHELRKYWRLQRLPDVKGIPKAFNELDQMLDLFHYDSDKSYTGRMWAYPQIWKKLK